jgi:sugar lactone lactonase YvrE
MTYRMTRPLKHLCILVGLAALVGASSPPAGAAPQTSGAVGAPATRVALGQPEDIAFDRHGSMYVSEFSGHRVDRVGATGLLTVIAGTGTAGYSGDGGRAVAAELNAPTGLIAEPDGSLLVADHHNGCIRRVSATGIITRVVGRCGHPGFSGDHGPARQAQLDDPIGIAQDAFGDLYIADEQNHRLRRVSPDGVITTVAGGGGHHIEQAPDGMLGTRIWLRHPSYLAIDPAGNVYMSDFWANVVIRVDRSGHVTHVAGTGTVGFAGDGGPATRAELDFPTGLALTSGGALYITDSFNNRIRKVSRAGVITTVAGTGRAGFAGDGGPALKARLNAPSGIALGPDGSLYIADQANNVVRVITRAGTIRTVAGVAPRVLTKGRQ